MRVWLAGSRAFGAEVYKELESTPGVQIIGVTCPLDNDDLWMTADCAYHGSVTESMMLAYKIDVIVSAQHYGHIPRDARERATWGAIGYHPSLLPRHRGRNAIVATVNSNDAIAGGTVYLMDNGWDTGPIILQDWCHVLPGWSAKDLWRESLFPMGVRLLGQVLKMTNIAHTHKHNVPWPLIEQDDRVATLC